MGLIRCGRSSPPRVGICAARGYWSSKSATPRIRCCAPFQGCRSSGRRSRWAEAAYSYSGRGIWAENSTRRWQAGYGRAGQRGSKRVAGNTFGRVFTVTSFGESHGPALGCVVDGCPPGMGLCEADLQDDVERRRPGASHYTRQRRESDTVRILSGVFEGRTTGTPIAVLVENEDQRSRDYEKIKDRFRPGHADYNYQQKYGFGDYRGGGRSSARETVVRVAAGAIARKFLSERLNIRIHGYLAQMGSLVLDPVSPM